jgi:uncharacterized RmlC-like cupin family protein
MASATCEVIRPCRALVAHSAPDDQAGIALLPELDTLV